MNTLQEISSLIRQSSLSISDQSVFIQLIQKATEKQLNDLAELFKKDKSAIGEIYNNLQVKRAVLAAKDVRSWESILNAEEKKLNGVNNSF